MARDRELVLTSRRESHAARVRVLAEIRSRTTCRCRIGHRRQATRIANGEGSEPQARKFSGANLSRGTLGHLPSAPYMHWRANFPLRVRPFRDGPGVARSLRATAGAKSSTAPAEAHYSKKDRITPELFALECLCRLYFNIAIFAVPTRERTFAVTSRP
jgi:hypothetical protein